MVNQCCLCKCKEFPNIIWLRCEQAFSLWSLIFVLFGVSWVLLHTIQDLMLGFHDSFVGKRHLENGSPLFILDNSERENYKDVWGSGAIRTSHEKLLYQKLHAWTNGSRETYTSKLDFVDS